MTAGKQTSSFRAQIIHSHSGEKSKHSFAGKEGTCWFPFQLWAYDWRVQTSAACVYVALTLDTNTQISFSAILLCFPVVPVWICCTSVRLYGPLLWRAWVLGRLLSLRRARVQQRRRFVRVEGPVVVLRPRGTWRPVLWHPPEVLKGAVSSLVVVGTEFIRTSSFGVRMPEIIYYNNFLKPVGAATIIWLID